MKKKLITMILLCTMSLSMLSCNDDKQKQASNDNNKPSQSTSNDNKNDKQGSDDATVNRTNTELPKDKENKEDNNEQAPKEMTSEEIVAKFNEIYPKIYTFFKEKLEKPNINRGDDFKVRIDKKDLDIKGYKGIVALGYHPDKTKHDEINSADFALGDVPTDPKKVITVGGSMFQEYSTDEIEKNGIKIKGTLFEEFINIISPQKVDIEELEKEATKNYKTGYSKRYGNTVIGITASYGDVRVSVMIG